MSELSQQSEIIYGTATLSAHNASPDEMIEFEIKLGVNGNDDYNVQGTSELRWTNGYNFANARADRRTFSQYTMRIVNGDGGSVFRKVNEKYWELKKRIAVVLVNNSWSKITLSTESKSPQPLQYLDIEEEVVRYVSRHSFFIGKVTRLDFSRVLTVTKYKGGNRPKYETSLEVESEYIGMFRPAMPRRGENINLTLRFDKIIAECNLMFAEYISNTEKVLQSMLNTPLMYTFTSLTNMTAKANVILSSTYEKRENITKNLNRKYFSEAKALDISFLNYKNMFAPEYKRGPPRSWYISLKTDGERRFLIISEEDGTYLVYPPYQAALYVQAGENKGIPLTIIDGELYEGVFYIIDGLIIPSDDGNWTDIRSDNYYTRYDKTSTWVNKMKSQRPEIFGELDVRTKEIVEVNGDLSNDFFSKVEDLWTRYNDAKEEYFLSDGIVFTPNYLSYTQTSEAKHIMKWKKSITIDLKYMKGEKGEPLLYVRGDEGDVSFYDIQSDLTGPERVNMKNIAAIPGSIIEFKCTEDKGLEAYKARPEKSGPNNESAARDNWEKANVTTKKITEATLFGKTGMLMRKYHNRIKSKLFHEGSIITGMSPNKENILLDIGSGRGGDLAKWKDYDMIICIEPNAEYRKEFNKRLEGKAGNLVRDKVFLLDAEVYGQDYRKIKKFVKEIIGDRQVNVISMMDSLTFFFDKDGESLKKLRRVVDDLLADGGKFIWKMMDGALVKKAFEEKGDEIKFGESDYIKKLSDNKIEVRIGENVSNEEFLTDVEVLKESLDISGEREIADNELLLSNDYKMLSSLYSYGVFYKGDAPVYSPNLVHVLGLSNLNGMIKYYEKQCRLEKSPESSSLLGVIEVLFTEHSHVNLEKRYFQVSSNEIPMTMKEERMPYTYYEVAYDAYFPKRLFKENIDGYVSAENIIVAKKEEISDEEESLAYLSLLQLDVFVVENSKVVATNCVDKSTNECVIINKRTSKRKGVLYTPEKGPNGYLFSSSAKIVKGLKKGNLLKAPNIEEIYVNTLENCLKRTHLERNYLFPYMVPYHRVYERIASLDKSMIDEKKQLIGLVLVAVAWLVEIAVDGSNVIPYLERIGIIDEKTPDSRRMAGVEAVKELRKMLNLNSL